MKHIQMGEKALELHDLLSLRTIHDSKKNKAMPHLSTFVHGFLLPCIISSYLLYPWRRTQQPTPIFLPEESCGQRSLVGYSPWSLKGSDMTEDFDPDAGKDWGQEEKGTTEDAMVGWHHWLNGHECAQTRGDNEGQGSLTCYCSWGHKESDTTERWNNHHHHQPLLPPGPVTVVNTQSRVLLAKISESFACLEISLSPHKSCTLHFYLFHSILHFSMSSSSPQFPICILNSSNLQDFIFSEDTRLLCRDSN